MRLLRLVMLRLPTLPLAALPLLSSLFAAPPARAITLPASFVADNAVTGALDTPVGIAFIRDGRFFVAEKRGRVWLVKNGVRGSTPVIAIENEVLNNGDRGLLSVAVDPNYYLNHYIYLLYTVDPDGNGVDDNDDAFGRITRYTMSSADTTVADPASRTILMGATWTQGPPSGSPSHTIGTLRFGSDGSLIVSVGDGASFSDTDAGGLDPGMFGAGKTDPYEDIGAFRAQYIGSLAGKILRINPANGQGYPSNPYWDGNGSSVQSRVWAYGFRNPYRIGIRPGGATDPAAGNPGSIYVGEVGWDTWEECNVITSPGGNHGWPCYEGPDRPSYNSAHPAHHSCSTIGTSSNPGPLKSPVMQWNHSSSSTSNSIPNGLAGNASIGGVFYTGTSYPTVYRGAYFFGDYGLNWIKVATMSASDQLTSLADFAGGAEGPVDFTTDPISGDVYYVSIVTNQVRRLRYTGSAPPPPPPASFPTTGVVDDFNRADGPVGGSWVASTTAGLAIVSSQLAQSSGFASAVWNGATFGADQEVFVTLNAITASSPEHDLLLKVQGQSWDTGHLEVRYDATQSRVLVSTYTPATGWRLWSQSGTITFAAGDRFGARALSDGSVTVFKNGVQVLSSSVAGWAYAGNGGRIGLTLDRATSSRLDNYGGGNVVFSSGGNRAPVAAASGSPTSGPAPLAVLFSSTGSSDPDGDPLTYSWIFGDGQSGTGPSPSHTYSTPGTYTATLTVSDGRGGQSNASVGIQATTVSSGGFPSTPVVDDFNRADGALGGSWVASTTAGLAIVANQLAQTSGGSSPVWNGAIFGPDQEAYVTLNVITASSPEHDLMLKVQGQTSDAGHLEVRYDATQSRVMVSTYTPGSGWRLWATSGTVTFAAGNQLGARAQSNGTVLVYKNGTQILSASVAGWAYAASDGRIGLTLDNATSSRLDNFGGGTVASGPPPANRAPVAVASGAPASGTAPLSVGFSNAGSSDPDGDVLTSSWVFGDGQSGSGATIAHTYNAAGTYAAVLTVSDGRGGQDTASVSIRVDPAGPVNNRPHATIATPANNTLYVAGQTITFSGSGSDTEDPASSLGYEWRFQLHHNNHTHPNFYVAAGATITYTPENHDDGTGVYYEVLFLVTDTGSLIDTARVNIYPEVDLRPSPVVTLPVSPVSPGITRYSFTIYNSGRMPAPISHWMLVAGTTRVAEGDTLVPALDSVKVTRSLPTIAPGTYNLRLAVDTLSTWTSVEISESNNAVNRSFVVRSSPAFPATSVLDNFNRQSGAIGGSWTGGVTGLAISKRELTQTSGSAAAVWNGGVFGADQEAYFTFKAITSTSTKQALMLKVQGLTFDTGHIEVRYDATTSRVIVSTYTPGTGFQVQGTSGTLTFTTNSTFGARVLADGTVNVYRNGAVVFSTLIASWTYLANGGRVGLSLVNATSTAIDNFGGGSVSVPAALAANLDLASVAPAPVPAGAPASGRIALSRPHPNPSDGEVSLDLELPRRAPVSLVVHDPMGRTIWRTPARDYGAGRWTLSWPGRDESGRPAPAGLYLLDVRVGDRTLTRRATLLR
jgi:glucose/arabinose dehydrogenase/PKD repeat protein